MISPKKIHEWIVKALEEPFFRAEMHRVDILLHDVKEPRLHLIEGGKHENRKHSAVIKSVS